jgi:hypothetical protein
MLTAAFVIGGCFAVYFLLRRRMAQASARMGRDIREQMASFSTRIAALERLAEARPQDGCEQNNAHVRAGDEASPVGLRDCNKSTAEPDCQNIPPEIMASITEQVAVLVGRGVQIRSVKVLPQAHVRGQEQEAYWAQQGRILIHSSHQIGQR